MVALGDAAGVAAVAVVEVVTVDPAVGPVVVVRARVGNDR
jgi:hypothetical protein